MKNILKSLIMLTLILSITFTHTFTASASELPTEAVYDFQKGGIQSFTIKTKDGEQNKIIIKEIESKTKVDSKTYQVSYQASSWTAGFYVVISNNQIGAAYNPFYSVTTGTISSKSLIKNSSTMVTYAFLYKAFAMTYDTGVIAKIVNKELVVTRR